VVVVVPEVVHYYWCEEADWTEEEEELEAIAVRLYVGVRSARL